jgi:hypothetical protein
MLLRAAGRRRTAPAAAIDKIVGKCRTVVSAAWIMKGTTNSQATARQLFSMRRKPNQGSPGRLMPTIRTRAKPRKTLWSDNFSKRAYVVCTILVFSWLLIHFRSEILNMTLSDYARPNDDLLSGSILSLPNSHNKCRQHFIDNETGQIRDNGLVDCTAAVTQNTDVWGHRMVTQRANAIHDSFVHQ